jgi:hypothetical protein
MYEAEESHIRKLLEEFLDEESNVEVGCASDLWMYGIQSKNNK